MRRRESNLTLEEDEDPSVEIERVSQPWMSRELFDTLWQNATQQVSSSCTFTKLRRFGGRQAQDAALGGENREIADEASVAARGNFQNQFLETLGSDLVVFPQKSEQSKAPFVVLAYASVTDNYGLRTVLLVRMEQLHESEQIGITVKNTDPVHRTRMASFLAILQQQIQPGSAPKRPQPRMADTSKLFLEETSDGATDSDSAPSTPPMPARTPPTTASATFSTPPKRSSAPSNEPTRPHVGPRPIERGRSHTVRYRTDRDISFEGYLSKKSDVLMHWKATYCVLEEDTLAFYETREDFISNTKLIGRIQLQAVEDEDIGKPNGFCVIAEGSHINHLSSRTAFEKEQWKRAITIAISKAPEVTRPYVAFASQPLEPRKFYRLLGALLRQEIGDFPLLFRKGETIPDELANSSLNGSHKEHRRPSKGTRFFRGLRRAAGISGERAVAMFGDPSGCVTSICKCLPAVSADNEHKAGTLNPDWSSNLRLEFPGCARGFTYFLKVEVFQSRFMLPDELLGVCKINVTPHLSLVNGSADAKANGALPRWHNLCDQYNDCKESWAPPTVFRGRIQLGIIFAPTVKSAEDFPQSQGMRRMASDGRLVESRRSSADETLLQSLSSYDLREFLQSEKRAGGGTVDVSSQRGGRFLSRQLRSRTESSEKSGNVVVNVPVDSEDDRELARLKRHNHTFVGKATVFDVPKKYQLIKVVGAGTYGEVVAASDIETGTTVAIKKVTNAFADLPDTKRILRELCLLRQLNHPNLIQLYDVPRPERLSYLDDIYLVTDLMETDLHRVIHSTQTLTDEHVAHFMRQILRALAYLHSANVLHRDLKPSNILVTSTCDAKICDLGLARYVDYSTAKQVKGSSKEDTFVELTEYVVTRWYRAPEILLDGCRYDKPSDLWSAGCILGELLGRKPLFPGSSTTNQLNKIFNVLGTPNISYISHIHKDAAQKWIHRQRRRSQIPFAELYPNANQQALDLLEKLLVYDPKQRITAVEALRHPYLREAFRLTLGDNIGDEGFFYDETEQKEDHFVGKIDDSNEFVTESKEAMQEAVFEQVCFFHPEAREYEAWLKKHDQKFCVDPITGKLVPVKN
ncbi:hypothetical protein PHYBOEH_011731 [Phytophthora boehmeriae]|uniref:Mitogen-activated protein kinase n=1 Tax=Phytophthora boehmeriae TaxID=109152 RepID=A0A8T1WW87_9STRA|nr:hypothetical protein PHYBOEH_011731 [Phytophthora boehmeriae]